LAYERKSKLYINNSNFSKKLEFFTFLLLFLLFYFLNYQQVFTDHYESDTIEHIEILKQYFSGERFIPHPLWHYGTYITSFILNISIQLAAVIFSTTLMTIWSLLIYYFIKQKIVLNQTKTINSFLYLSFMLCTIFIGPLVIPGEYIIYLGKGVPTVWHNITLWMLKPFAFLTIYFLTSALNNNSTKYYIYTFIFAIISLFAKPSFIIIFLPSLFIILITNKYYNKKNLLFFIILSLTSILILLYQLVNTFSNSEIIFDFLGVWSRHSSNIPLSIFLALAFPIIFTFLNKIVLEEPIFQLLWLQIFFGIVLYACFAQEGEQYTHANFSWSYLIAMNLLYLFTIVRFIQNYYIIPLYKRNILTLLLVIQVAIGCYYFFRVLQGQNPLYISILFLR